MQEYLAGIILDLPAHLGLRDISTVNLSDFSLEGKTNWTMLSVWIHLTLHSRYISYTEVFRTYLPFAVILTLAGILYVAM